MIEIKILDQKVYAFHGVYEEEKKTGQEFLISVKALCNYDLSSANDELGETLSYADLAGFVERVSTFKAYDLIETLANELADSILEKFKIVKEVEVEVKKPSAPMPQKMAYPSVKLSKKWHEVFIAIGTNLGDKEDNIARAIAKLKDFCLLEEVATYIDTKPWGVSDQPDFLNTVVKVKTLLEPFALLRNLKAIEENLGRVKTRRWGERIIDLDIIFYDDLVLEEKELAIPHPYMEDRDFVLVPLAEIAPYKLHPILKKRVFRLLDELDSH